jgi:pimeloyl-ACP methyl ester carboxylesterase
VHTRYRQVWFAVSISLTVSVSLAVSGCSVGPSQRPPVAVRGDAVPAAPVAPGTAVPTPDALPNLEPQNASIPFSDCTADTRSALPAPSPQALRFECAELTVPADPAAPQLGGVTLGVLRAGLVGAPTTRPPLLVVGDSAGDASAVAAARLAEQVSPAVLATFTLIGLDRRGAGADRLGCAPPDARAALVDADPAKSSAGALTSLLDRARAVVQECNLTLDSSLSTIAGTTTAADVESLRGALGVAHLSAIGVGDGAGALVTWAGTAPQAVGRLVLDGPPQPGLDEPDRSAARAKAAEATFDAFALSCTARPGCPLGAAPPTTVTGLMKALGARPLVAADGRRLTAGAAITAIRTTLGEPRSWPALTAAIAAASTGDPAPMLDLLDPLLGPRGRFDGALAIGCNDTRNRFSPSQIAAIATRWTSAYPLFGGEAALGLLDCAPWPTGGTDPPPPPATGAPPILVLGTAADPRAPLDGSRRAADALPGARFLSWLGAGTGAYPRTPCVAGKVDAMLLNGALPQDGVLCPP